MLRPGSLLSRTFAVLVLLGLLIGAYRLIVRPVVSSYEVAAQSIEQSRSLLERYRALAAQQENLAALVAERERAAAESTAYLDGPTGALAAAALQDQVGAVIARAGGDLRSTRVLTGEPVEQVAGISRAGLRLDLRVDVEGLERLLYEIETDEPYLFIEQITVRERHGQQTGRIEQERSVYDVSIELYGYTRTPE